MFLFYGMDTSDTPTRWYLFDRTVTHVQQAYLKAETDY